ncbi:hypothetical protein GSI_08890 [Ganoderma sinense ZZ0214-1]|uniref:Protein kinase domain-containing protein n=1 Tax=Ganoderma sinense ZZ0214-1 TaxID=1077348 RepID=A0A2G8S540_9APHY|nr:hypothetical protein GSI_08890 [Ganoderma sinense ZZ0214-1]
MLGMDLNPNTIFISNRGRDPHEVDPEGRKRRLCSIWKRNPDGPYLEKDRAPVGYRTPNGLVWGHTIDELCLIERDPGLPIFTQYSRSQLKELGENYDDVEWDYAPLVRPRVKRPWPILKLPKRHPANTTPPIGVIDGGCGEEHDEDCTYTIRWDEFSDDRKGKTTPRAGQPPPACSTDPANPCTGCWLTNHPDASGERLRNPAGHVYDYVWCEHFAVCAQESGDPCAFLGQKTHLMIWEPRIFADFAGVLKFDAFRAWHKFLPPGALDAMPKHYRATAEERAGDSSSEAAHPKVSGLYPCEGLPFSFSVTDLDPEDEEFYYQARENGFQVGKVDGEGKTADAPGLFNLKDLPKLEEFIPEGLFPDILLVHDPGKLTNHTQPGGEPVKYKRLFPVLPRDLTKTIEELPTTDHIAHLHLHKSNPLGTGHHSCVYRASLTLPPPLSARSHTGQCTVAAKLAFPHCTAHALLANEAKVYSELPRHTQEEYCGFNIAPPCNYPVPVGAIAPKFFGYYVPVGEDSEAMHGYSEHKKEHRRCGEWKPCKVEWTSPILLIEECGEPVKPETFSADERTECFSLLHRLHKLNILQGSPYVRNVLVQPGPLTDPPERRSLATPSFRVVDFGRGEVYAEHADMTRSERERARDAFAARIRDEQRAAREEMLLEYPCGF